MSATDGIDEATGNVEVEVLEDDDERRLALVEAHAADIATRDQEVRFTDAQKELIRSINSDANPAELQVFMYQAARTGLDPIARQIYLIKRKGKMSIQTGIDGYRLVADRTGKMAGSDEPVFEVGEDGLPIKATVTVWKIAADGGRYPYTATARWSEYAPDMNLPESFMWKKMPFGQIGKCAEALALRKACPAELSGIYTDDEMAQADFSTLGKGPTLPTTEHKCPSCGSAVLDNREANAAEPAPGRKAPPAWKCSNDKCQGGGKKKDRSGNPTGENWPWGTYDLGYFEAGGDGGYEGGETIEVTRPPAAEPDRAQLEAAWDKPLEKAPDTFVTGAPQADAWAELYGLVDDTLWVGGINASITRRTQRIYELMIHLELWPAESLHTALARYVETAPAVQADTKIPKEPKAVGELLRKENYQAFATRTIEWAKTRLAKETR